MKWSPMIQNVCKMDRQQRITKLRYSNSIIPASLIHPDSTFPHITQRLVFELSQKPGVKIVSNLFKSTVPFGVCVSFFAPLVSVFPLSPERFEIVNTKIKVVVTIAGRMNTWGEPHGFGNNLADPRFAKIRKILENQWTNDWFDLLACFSSSFHRNVLESREAPLSNGLKFPISPLGPFSFKPMAFRAVIMCLAVSTVFLLLEPL